MNSSLQTFAFACSCLTYSLSVILNTFGIYILSNLNRELTNQRIFLMNLSVSELLYASLTLGYYLVTKISDNNQSTVFAIFSRISWFFYYLYLISPLPLTMDRLICIVFPWKYKAIFHRTKAIIVIFSTWMCVLLIAIPTLLITDYETARNNHLSSVALGIEVVVVAIAIVAYSLIGLKVHRQGKLTGQTNNESKTLKVATIIIITYIILEVVPCVVTTVLFNCCPDVAQAYRRLIYTPSGLNAVSDPIVYLYNYPPLKAAVKKKLNHVIAKLRCTHRQSSIMDDPRPQNLSDTPV